MTGLHLGRKTSSLNHLGGDFMTTYTLTIEKLEDRIAPRVATGGQ